MSSNGPNASLLDSKHQQHHTTDYDNKHQHTRQNPLPHSRGDPSRHSAEGSKVTAVCSEAGPSCMGLNAIKNWSGRRLRSAMHWKFHGSNAKKTDDDADKNDDTQKTKKKTRCRTTKCTHSTHTHVHTPPHILTCLG